MGIYLFLIAFSVFLYVLLKPSINLTNKKVYIVLVMLSFFIVAGFRDFSIGIDTKQFTNAFNLIVEGRDTRYELGFVYLCKIIGYFTSDAGVLLILVSMLGSITIGYLIYKESSNVLLSVLLFMFLNFYFLSMNMMRQWIALCIVLFGYELFLTKDKYLLFFASCIFAFLFHKTALCCLLFIPIRVFKKFHFSDLFMLVVVSISATLFVFSSKILPLVLGIFDYKEYLLSEFTKGSNIAGYLLFAVSFLLMVITYYYGHVKDGENKEYFLVICLAVVIFSLGIKISIFERIANYFYIFTVFKFPSVLSSIKIKSNEIIIKYSATILFFIYWIVICLYRPEWYGAIPYLWR